MKVSFVQLWAIGYACAAMAQSPGTFAATGNMSAARYGHTATLLTNGKVLIAGGVQSIIGSAELYDPSTRTFTATGNMSAARSGHRATRLPDGKVLITGGSALESGSLASAELYDPSTGTFTATGGLTVTRRGHTATLLNTGKVLIAGGSDPQHGLGASAELYDPSTGTFTATGDMTTIYRPGTGTLLDNGKVLVDGEGDNSVPIAQLYDPETGTFGLTGGTAPMYSAFSATASLLTNGKVLETLQYSCDPSDEAVLYDPSTGTFTTTGNLTTYRWDVSTSTLLPDGTVLIAGKWYAGSGAELYDPAAGTFSPTGDMTASPGRLSHTATLLPDGTVLIAGGASVSTLASAEIYHPVKLIAAPVLFSLAGDGRGQGAIWHAATGQLALPGNPAIAGEAVAMYTTGLPDGGAIPPQVAVGSRLAEILFFGNAPGYPGFNQVNFRVPSGVAPGPAVPVRLTYLGRPSNEVAIGVR
jgi:hypothetical protein